MLSFKVRIFELAVISIDLKFLKHSVR